KWQVRELSRHPARFRQLASDFPGRILFGSDIVATDEKASHDFFASRYWALRTLMETDYDGPSPIVDPDLSLVDPTQPADATAHLRGALLPAATLQTIYHDAADQLLQRYPSSTKASDS
ncbi:MAG: hypothetical protein R3336_10260, partial [Phycisphaeraceae bacterium]|nr:hypothetical protein [Phycisphaeraceae bacterium]